MLRTNLSARLWEAVMPHLVTSPTSWSYVFKVHRRELCWESHLKSDPMNEESDWGLSCLSIMSLLSITIFLTFGIYHSWLIIPFIIIQSKVLLLPSHAPISAGNETEQPTDGMQYCSIAYLWLIFFLPASKHPKALEQHGKII